MGALPKAFALGCRSHLGIVRLQKVVQVTKYKGLLISLFGFVTEPNEAAGRSQHDQTEQVEEGRLV